MTNKTITIYKVNDPRVSNVVLFDAETNSFKYIPVSEVDEVISNYKEKGVIVSIKELPAGAGEKIVIPLDSAPENNPDKDYDTQAVCAVISVIPKRYGEKDVPKVFAAEGVTPAQYAKFTGAQELVVDIMDKKLLKSKTPLKASPSPKNKEDIAGNIKKTHKSSVRVNQITPNKKTQQTPPPKKEMPIQNRSMSR